MCYALKSNQEWIVRRLKGVYNECLNEVSSFDMSYFLSLVYLKNINVLQKKMRFIKNVIWNYQCVPTCLQTQFNSYTIGWCVRALLCVCVRVCVSAWMWRILNLHDHANLMETKIGICYRRHKHTHTHACKKTRKIFTVEHFSPQ